MPKSKIRRTKPLAWLDSLSELARQKSKRESKSLRQKHFRAVKATHEPWPLAERPGFLIRRLHQIHVALFQQACGQFEVTPLQYSLLSALAARKTADQTTLAADIALDRTTTTGALKRLEARHLVERPINTADRRARLCRLTRAGAALLARIESAARTAHETTLDGLSDRERTQFVAMMQRLVATNANHDTSAPFLE